MAVLFKNTSLNQKPL